MATKLIEVAKDFYVRPSNVEAVRFHEPTDPSSKIRRVDLKMAGDEIFLIAFTDTDKGDFIKKLNRGVTRDGMNVVRP